jgi:elongation factor G
MPEYTSKDIRNIVAVGHGGAGKTTLLDAMLFKAGAVTRAGSVAEKSSVFDFEDEEKERGNSIFASMAFCRWKNTELNLVNTPGFMDFAGAAISGIHAGDLALVAVSAQRGVELNARKMNAVAKGLGLARVVVITKMDGENIVDYDAVIAKVQEVFGNQCLPVNLPVGIGPAFSGVVGVLQPPASAPAGVVGDVEAAAGALMDKIVEADEKLMEKYLNGDKISPEELATTLRKAIAAGALVPILHTSGAKSIGVEELMDFLAAYAPSPADMPVPAAKDVKGEADVALACDAAKPLAARVFKTVVDPFVGKLSYFRILQGTLPADSHVTNSRTGKNERVAQLFRIFGKETRTVTKGIAGDICAVSKIEDIHIGDALCDGRHLVTLPKITFPLPMASLAIEPKARGDEQKISGSVQKIADGDPTFIPRRDQQTGEMIVTGMSQLHLDVMLHRLEKRFGVGVATKPPRIPYKETISVPSEGMYRHKKQSGGRGQFGEVHFRMFPMERGAGFEFVDAIVGGSVPNQFIPAVEKGVRETLVRGVIAGYPVEDVRVELFFGKYHDVDSSEAAFKLAASMCFQECFMKAKPVLLEPIMNLEIMVPSQHMGDISGDLNSRRGRIVGMDSDGDMQIIRAQAPLGEVMRYSTELRSMTGGTGSYTMELSHYDVVPARAAEQIIALAKKEKEEARAG